METSNKINNLQEFVGKSIKEAKKYFEENGYEITPCFNDYKWVFSKPIINKYIIIKVDHSEESDEDGIIEIITKISEADGIYHDYSDRPSK